MLIEQGRDVGGRTATCSARWPSGADYPEAQSAMGVVLAMQGRVDEALPHFERAVALRPDYVDAWANYAEALASRGTAHRRGRGLPQGPRAEGRQPAGAARLGVDSRHDDRVTACETAGRRWSTRAVPWR